MSNTKKYVHQVVIGALFASVTAGIQAAEVHDALPAVKAAHWPSENGPVMEKTLASWKFCDPKTISWKQTADSNRRRTVTFSCALPKDALTGVTAAAKTAEAAKAQVAAYKAYRKAAGKELSGYEKAIATVLEGQSGLKDVSVAIALKIYEDDSFEPMDNSGGLKLTYADGTVAYLISSADLMANAFGTQSGFYSRIDLKKVTPKILAETAVRQAPAAWSSASGWQVSFGGTIREPHSTVSWENPLAKSNTPGDVEYPAYAVTKETALKALDSLLLPNVYHCNTFFSAKMRAALAGNTDALARFDFFENAVCKNNNFIRSSGYNYGASRYAFGDVSPEDIKEIRARFDAMATPESIAVTEDNCSRRALTKINDDLNIIREADPSGWMAANNAAGLWSRHCRMSTSPSGKEFLSKVRLIKPTGYFCDRELSQKIRELAENYVISNRDWSAVPNLYVKVSNGPIGCRKVLRTAPFSDLKNAFVAPAADDATRQSALAYIEKYTQEAVCTDKKPCTDDVLASIRKAETQGYDRLVKADADRFAKVRSILCDELGYCAYGLLADAVLGPVNAPRSTNRTVQRSAGQNTGTSQLNKDAQEVLDATRKLGNSIMNLFQ